MVMRRQLESVDDIVLAEASAWLARLQGPERTPAVETAFRAWLAMEPAHAQAFARVTEAWEMVPGAARLRAQADAMKAGLNPRAARRPWLAVPAALAACAALVAAAGLVWWSLQDPVYHTAVGEQRTVTLDDGTRIALNTDSRLSVAYDDGERRVRLERGEALFEVMPQPQRPFIVEAGSEQVRALGTTFVVRRDPDRLAVSLIEGRVEVEPRASTQQASRMRQARAGTTVLSPGERIVVRADAPRHVDRPRIEVLTAWRHGEVMFDDITLADALAELDRYGRNRVRLADPELSQLRISGVFATRDSAEFARSIAQLHGLRVERAENGIVLRR